MRGVCLGARYLWFLSLFWVILDRFLFQFSPRIGQSNTNFCWVLQCRCRFRNRQPKTMSLPIQKLAAKTVSLLIFELAARNYVADDLEIGRDGGVILTLIFFVWVFTFISSYNVTSLSPLLLLLITFWCHQINV